jgi:phosphoglycerate dehydrogenase-like enzyme
VRSIRVLFLPQEAGSREPWLSDVAAALDGSAELLVLDSSDDLAAQFDGVRVVIDQGGHASREVIDAGAAAGVELWQILGTGLDHTEVDYILGKRMKLANTPGSFSAIALAEHAILLMLLFAKKYREGERNLRSGVMYLPVGEELAGATLGLVGLGASGRALAARARALAMRIIAIDIVHPSSEELNQFGVEWFGAPSDLPRLLQEADYVSLHLPLTTATRHLIDAAALSLMKTSAVLINVSRGAIVDEDALARALLAGKLHGAGIDVYSTEPPPHDHPLFGLQNVIATPHIAGGTVATSSRRAAACGENVRRIANGLSPLYEVTSAT